MPRAYFSLDCYTQHVKIKALSFLAALALCVLWFTPWTGAGESAGRRLVLILIDRVTWADLAEAKATNLEALARRGAVGFLSTRTAKPETTSVRSYLTIGAGTRGDAVGATGYPLNKERFKALVAANRRSGYNARVGLLSTVLWRGRRRVGVYGNADAVDIDRHAFIFGREAELIGVNERGKVFGDTSENPLMPRPGPARARLAALIGANDVLILETGETRRADVAGLSSGRVRARRLKLKAIARTDRFIGEVAGRLDPSRDMLMVVSPSAPLDRDGSPGKGLTPIIMAGPRIKAGLLTSPSTRRSGLVAATDIAPTIANYFGLRLGSASNGRPIQSVSGRASFGQMGREADEYLLTERLSLPIIFTYGWVEGALLALVVLGLTLAKPLVARLRGLFRLLLLSILAAPLAIFITPLFPFALDGAKPYIATILAACFAIAFIAWLLPEKTLSPLIFISGATTIFIVGNLLVGAPADSKAALGYTAITAGRFYGIGNEYLSVFMPAALVFSLLWLEASGRGRREVRPFLGLFFALSIFMIGFGGLGANTGGIIMTAPAFTFAYLGLSDRMDYWRRSLIAALVTFATLALLAVGDAVFAKEPTHLGVAARQVYRGPLSALVTVVKRKVMLNIAVFNYSYWSYVVLAVLGGLIIWQISRERQGLTWAAQRHPLAGLALTSGVIGGAVGSVANDSGISVMAIVLGYLIMVILYLEVAETTGRQAID